MARPVFEGYPPHSASSNRVHAPKTCHGFPRSQFGWSGRPLAPRFSGVLRFCYGKPTPYVGTATTKAPSGQPVSKPRPRKHAGRRTPDAGDIACRYSTPRPTQDSPAGCRPPPAQPRPGTPRGDRSSPTYPGSPPEGTPPNPPTGRSTPPPSRSRPAAPTRLAAGASHRRGPGPARTPPLRSSPEPQAAQVTQVRVAGRAIRRSKGMGKWQR